MAVMTLDNFNASQILDTALAGTLLKLSGYNEKKKEEFEKARATYKNLIEDLRHNLEKTTSIEGLETKMIDLLKFVDTDELQNEFNFFEKVANGATQKSEVAKKNLATKIAIIFKAAIKEKERQAEKERREIVGAKLRIFREMRGLSQEEVAKALDTNKSLIANYETGYREPSIKNLVKLAKILNLSLDWLLDVPVPQYEKLQAE